MTTAEKQAVRAVRDELPRHLDRKLPVKLRRDTSDAVLAALATGTPQERTPAQLVQFRVMARWDGYWGSLFGRDDVKKPVGAFLKMIERTAECGNARCDDRVDVDSGQSCTACAVRVDDQRQQRKAGAAVGQVAEEYGAAGTGWYPDVAGADAGTPPTWVPEQRDDEPRDPVVRVPAIGAGVRPNDLYRQQRDAARARKADRNA